MLTRPIPDANELIPVIGLGTYEVFDVAGSAEEIDTRKEIVDMLVGKGGSLVDSSPMYNRSEKVVGDIINASGNRDDLFLATKVWINGKSAGESQMRRSRDLMNAGVIDLMQVHNLRDVDVQMATIREWQAEGRIRYNGITHYTESAHRSMIRSMEDHNPQFIQINYSIGEREAEERVLPLAEDLGMAERIRFERYATDDEVTDVIQGSIALIVPSVMENEAFALVQLEAMRLSKAIINTNLQSSVPWVARDQQEAITVLPGDAKALADAMLELVSDPELAQRLGNNGLVRYKKEFSAERFTAALDSLYADLISAKPQLSKQQKRLPE